MNYTDQNSTVIARYQVDRDQPNRAVAGSGEPILSFTQPYNNHNGGKIEFGPDGYLYIATGDGGSAGDPQNNAQNLGSLLGKILRIDVDNPDNGRAYGIPAITRSLEISRAIGRKSMPMALGILGNSALIRNADGCGPLMWGRTAWKRLISSRRVAITAGTGWRGARDIPGRNNMTEKVWFFRFGNTSIRSAIPSPEAMCITVTTSPI